MYNVIFYDELISKTIEDGTRTIVYRVPSKYVCTTMRNGDNFFLYSNIENFIGSMPSLISASSMFEGSDIKFIKDVKKEKNEETGLMEEIDIPADFNSVMNSYRMFADCKNLENVNIGMNGITSSDLMFSGCDALKSISGNMDALEDATAMFIDNHELETFNVNMKRLRYADIMFCGTKLTDIISNFDEVISANQMYKDCSQLTSVTINMPSLEEGDEMFKNSSISSINFTAQNLNQANEMFANCQSLTSVTCSFPSLKWANKMFHSCKTLSSIKIDLPNLERAHNMFTGNVVFTSFEGNLNNLEDGTEMFYQTMLRTFITNNLDNLLIGKNMFKGCKIMNWAIPMPNLIDGTGMFESNYMNGNTSLSMQSFKSDLSALKTGTNMFKDCRNLTSFEASLDNLNNAQDMFYNCKLDAKSVMFIIETLPKYDSGSHLIGIGINNDGSSLDDFASETGLYSNWTTMKSRLSSKGWTATWYNSNGSTIA